MKKSLIVLSIIFLLLPVTITAQSFDALWKQVDQAQEKDLPKTQISLLKKIEKKAQQEKAYGHLLAAALQASELQTQISPDSLEVEMNKLKIQTKEAERKDEVLGAVYNCILGSILRSKNDKNADEYFKKALANPSLLARQKAEDFKPLVEIGEDDSIFNGDLLHVIGMQVGDYEKLTRYYTEKGNREAACYTAMMGIDEDEENVPRLDSLIQVYGDLPICGEVAVKRYRCMDEDAPVAERIAFIDKALARWASWKGITVLRNVREKLVRPKFNVKMTRRSVSSSEDNNKVNLNVRNLSDITLTITRTTLDGNHLYNLRHPDGLKKIKASLIPSTQQTIRRTFSGHEDYEEFEDSFLMPKLPLGVYFVKVETSDKRVDDDYGYYFVSNLYVMTEQQPDNKSRYVVVNVVDGQPVSDATVRVKYAGRYGKAPIVKTAKTDKNGEVLFVSEPSTADVYVYTAKDKAFCSTSLKSYYSFSNNKDDGIVTKIFTDRSIYRPGQTVHASVIVYEKNKEGFKTKAQVGKTFDMILYDANDKEVSRKSVTTDRFGTAATDFELPASGLTGRFSIYADYASKGLRSFQVDEYKRPTFEVNFDEYKEKYAIGDSIKLVGRAKSFAGVPVQGAKVHYVVTRRPSYWCGFYENNEEVKTGDVMTDDKGEFTVTVPFVLSADVIKEMNSPKRYYSRFYNFAVEASVTDAAGETRDGYASLPLGTKEARLSCSIPEKNLRDSLKTFKFNYVNAAGNPVEGMVKYVIVSQQKDKSKYVYNNYKTVKANEPVVVKGLGSSTYRMHAICGTDTLDTDFIVFSMDDKRPVIETHDWSYLSETTFPRNGGPIYMQVGSTDNNQHVVYSIYSGNKVIETGSFNQSNSIHTRKFYYKEEYGDGITLNYAWVKNGELYSHTWYISRPLPDKRLIVKWKSFRNKLIPGQKEEWTVTINRPDGKTVDAQLMATLYDKSLDEIMSHSWNFSPSFSLNYTSVDWRSSFISGLSLSALASLNPMDVSDVSISHFDNSFFMYFDEADVALYSAISERNFDGMTRSVMSKAVTKEEVVTIGYGSKSVARETASDVQYDQEIKPSEEKKNGKGKVSMRENLNETAFFYPQLQTDGKGNVSIKFTLPESLTTWRFMGLAHDEDMNSGFLSDDIIAQKTLMVQPNMPRFVRMGDKAMVSARLFNQSEKDINATAKIEILDPATEKVLFTDSKAVLLKADGSSSATYSLASLLAKNANKLNADQSLLIVRFMVEGNGFSDGEQHYLPVLQNQEYVTNTFAFSQNEAGVKTIDVSKLFPKKSMSQKLTVEYTNNPNWLMIQALPYVADANEKNAISLVTAYYVNSLGKKIISTSPAIKQTIEQWKKESGKETSMMSALEKNQELKTLVLEETPWLQDANNEREQKQKLVRFFDENQLQNKLTTTLTSLKKLQNPDGSFSWWPGMDGGLYMTVAVTKTLARLQNLTGPTPEVTKMINASFRYMDKKVAKCVAEMKRDEKKYNTTLFPANELCDYLYTNALFYNDRATNDIKYLIDRLTKKPVDLTIYGKANTAVILQQYGKVDKAREYLQSLNEYTVYKEEMGRYFDTKRAYYSWRDYKIPTEVAAIEAVKTITPTDGKTLAEMQRWLLQQKRTQAWDTPLNSVDAIWTFMNNGNWLMQNGEHTSLMLDNKPLQTTQPTAGLGYVKSTQPVDFHSAESHDLVVSKASTGTSWGAVYAQFFQTSTDISDAASGLKIKREVMVDSVQSKNGKELKVGDKVRIRLTIVADRNYDFVQVVDKRAACLEPVSQVSGYRRGYYIAPKDYTTNYYFDQMAKGKHVVETEYYIDRAGVYQTGTCTAQCAYAPEYSGRTGATVIQVDE